jgi:hypothetical protein
MSMLKSWNIYLSMCLDLQLYQMNPNRTILHWDHFLVLRPLRGILYENPWMLCKVKKWSTRHCYLCNNTHLTDEEGDIQNVTRACRKCWKKCQDGTTIPVSQIHLYPPTKQKDWTTFFVIINFDGNWSTHTNKYISNAFG